MNYRRTTTVPMEWIDWNAYQREPLMIDYNPGTYEWPKKFKKSAAPVVAPPAAITVYPPRRNTGKRW